MKTAGLLLLALALGGAAHASQLIVNLDAGKSQTVVLYGTSLTQYGRWADTVPGHSGLSDWLTSRYGSLATVINSGMAGKGSNTGVANLSTQVLAYHPDTVFIEFSMNDAFTAYDPSVLDYNISLAQSRANLNTMIDRILAANSSTEIILLTMNPAIDISHYTSGSDRPDLAAYYQIYRDVAAERGLQLIDIYPNWVQLENTNLSQFQTDLPDGLHPIAPASLAITLPTIEQALLAPEPQTVALFFMAAVVLVLAVKRHRRIA